MNIFTTEELRPSDYTLNIVRQIAHDYCVMKKSGRNQSYYLN